MQALWPRAGSEAIDATDDLDRALQQKQHASDRNERLELIDGRARGAVGRMFMRHPGLGGEAVTRIDESEDARKEEQEIEHEVRAGLRPGLPFAIEEIAAHVAIAAKRVSTRHHA